MNIQCLSLNKTRFIGLLFGLILIISCGQPVDNEKIRLFVAAGLSQSMDSLTRLYSKKKYVQFEMNAASSGTLAKQIEQGAPADIYFSANIKWMEYLAERKMICDSCHKTFAGNQLVLVSAKSNTLNNSDLHALVSILKPNKKLAIGIPEHVPAGKYAVEAFGNLNIYESIKQSLIYTKDVRAALILAEMGEAEYAIVYKTDALSSKKAKILTTIPDSLHSKIDLSVALLESDNAKAKAFCEFVSSNEAKKVFRHFGFRVED